MQTKKNVKKRNTEAHIYVLAVKKKCEIKTSKVFKANESCSISSTPVNWSWAWNSIYWVQKMVSIETIFWVYTFCAHAQFAGVELYTLSHVSHVRPLFTLNNSICSRDVRKMSISVHVKCLVYEPADVEGDPRGSRGINILDNFVPYFLGNSPGKGEMSISIHV